MYILRIEIREVGEDLNPVGKDVLGITKIFGCTDVGKELLGENPGEEFRYQMKRITEELVEYIDPIGEIIKLTN
ncbi:MAG: hypothetical protein WC476_01420 [Phycisphaerae bacterium]|jgi:hypothetical protein